MEIDVRVQRRRRSGWLSSFLGRSIVVAGLMVGAASCRGCGSGCGDSNGGSDAGTDGAGAEVSGMGGSGLGGAGTGGVSTSDGGVGGVGIGGSGAGGVGTGGNGAGGMGTGGRGTGGVCRCGHRRRGHRRRGHRRRGHRRPRHGRSHGRGHRRRQRRSSHRRGLFAQRPHLRALLHGHRALLGIQRRRSARLRQYEPQLRGLPGARRGRRRQRRRQGIQLALGASHTCALLDNGHVRCWGDSMYGQLGYGNKDRIGDCRRDTSLGRQSHRWPRDPDCRG